jgi:hypothetical protein
MKDLVSYTHTNKMWVHEENEMILAMHKHVKKTHIKQQFHASDVLP